MAPDREPFAVIRTKTPFDEKSVLRLDLEQPKNRGGQIKKDYFLIKSNAFVDAASQAFSTRSLASLVGLPLPAAEPTRARPRRRRSTPCASTTARRCSSAPKA